MSTATRSTSRTVARGPARAPRSGGSRAAAAAPAQPLSLSLDAQLCFALYSASLAMTKRYRAVLDPLALTYPQYLVMLALWEQDELGVSALGERLYLDSGTLTPLLKRLEAAGLLERRRDPRDERRVCVRLTAAGRQLRRRASPVPASLLASTGCTLPELQALTGTLRALRANLSDAPGGDGADG